MLKLVKLLFKMAIFAIIVLVLGNWIHWRGRTISDQVRVHLSHAESSAWVGQVKGLAGRISTDANQGLRKTLSIHARSEDEIPRNERQKLRALMQELNSSHSSKD